MRFAKYFSPRFAFALIRNILFRMRYIGHIELNIFKVYIEAGVRLRIAGGGRITFCGKGDRIYVTRGCDLSASGGTITIGAGAFFNKNCTIVAHSMVSIGQDVMLGPNVSVYDSDHRCEIGPTPFKNQGYVSNGISIGRNVWIGQNSVVAKGSQIGESVVIAANSLVRGVLETGGLYAGTPVRRIRSLDSNCA